MGETNFHCIIFGVASNTYWKSFNNLAVDIQTIWTCLFFLYLLYYIICDARLSMQKNINLCCSLKLPKNFLLKNVQVVFIELGSSRWILKLLLVSVSWGLFESSLSEELKTWCFVSLISFSLLMAEFLFCAVPLVKAWLKFFGL